MRFLTCLWFAALAAISHAEPTESIESPETAAIEATAPVTPPLESSPSEVPPVESAPTALPVPEPETPPAPETASEEVASPLENIPPPPEKEVAGPPIPPESVALEGEATPAQTSFLPSPFALKDIEWGEESGAQVFVEEKASTLLITGKLNRADLYLQNERLPVSSGSFTRILALNPDGGSFLFTLEDQFGERTTYQVSYTWLQTPGSLNEVLIKDGDTIITKKLNRTAKAYPAKEWLNFHWEMADCPLPPLNTFEKAIKRTRFLNLNVAGVLGLQSGGGNLISSKFAWNPFLDYGQIGGALELGLTPVKDKRGKVISQMNLQLFGRYHFDESYLGELGLGFSTNGFLSGASASMLTLRGSRRASFLPFLHRMFAAYTLIGFDTKINQFEFGLAFLF